MLPLSEIFCLSLELGEPFISEGTKYQPIGSPQIGYMPKPRRCKFEFICSFRQKHGRCPTGEEIVAKCFQQDN